MFMTCWLFLPAPFMKSDGGNPASSYFTTLLTVCAIPAMIWLDWCQFGKFWVETCSLLFMKAWIPLCCTHILVFYGQKVFLWFIKNHSFERWYHWWIKYWMEVKGENQGSWEKTELWYQWGLLRKMTLQNWKWECAFLQCRTVYHNTSLLTFSFFLKVHFIYSVIRCMLTTFSNTKNWRKTLGIFSLLFFRENETKHYVGYETNLLV